MTLGEKVRKLRTDAGLSQAQLADELMVSRAAVARWENGNGLPDIANLQILADHFGLEVDALIDDTKNLAEDSSAAAEPKGNTFCGKICDACELKSQLRCPGCKKGLGMACHHECQIAECCAKRGTLFCKNCVTFSVCGILRRSESIPRSRWEQLQRQASQREAQARKLSVLSKYVWPLFFINLTMYIIDLVAGWMEAFPAAYAVLYGIILLLQLAHGVILLLLRKADDDFAAAGWLTIGYGISNSVKLVMTNIIDNKFLILLPTLIALVLQLTAVFREYGAYSFVLGCVGGELAGKWEKVRKLYILSSLGTLLATLVAALFPVLGALAVLVGMVCILVATVKVMYYRYLTAKTIT